MRSWEIAWKEAPALAKPGEMQIQLLVRRAEMQAESLARPAEMEAELPARFAQVGMPERSLHLHSRPRMKDIRAKAALSSLQL